MDHHHTSLNLRWAAAAALTTTAAIHIELAPAHLREAPYAGVLFIALSAAALIIAALLVWRDHKLAWIAAGVVSIGALAAYAVSRSVGLPLLSDDVGDWLNPLGLIAVVSETTTALICLRRQAGDTALCVPGWEPQRYPPAWSLVWRCAAMSRRVRVSIGVIGLQPAVPEDAGAGGPKNRTEAERTG